MRTHKLVIVSNRLPVNVSKVEGTLTFSHSSGGLATAMSSLKQDDRIWVGWPGIASDDLTPEDKREISKELEKYDCYPVHLNKEQIELFYEGYANDTLWPLFHYFQSYAKYSEKYWKAYKEVNEVYEKAVARVSAPAAKIWIHDYHLMLLPGMVRLKLPDASIGFFLHIPFPSYEIYRLLPERKELLHGLLGADLIGFHVYDYARHFLSSCLRLLGLHNSHGTVHYDDRTVRVDAYPISIDYPKFKKRVQAPAVKEAIARVKEQYKKQKIILSVDRLDYSKGIPQRLEAFRRLLENSPEYIGKVKLVMIAVPSRTEVDTYRDLRDEIEQTVSRINGTFSTVEWAPISYQFQNLPFDEVLALYATADIALVTPLRDGMNLVAKEYVAAKQKEPGVLLLSEMTGAIDELPEALSINPNDASSVEKAIKKALRMPKTEQRNRIRAMQERLTMYPVQAWGEDFLAGLTASASSRQALHRKLLGVPALEKMAKTYKSASSRLIILDYDGTIQPYHSTPSPAAARPSAKLLQMLEKLATDKKTTLAVVSGRPKFALDGWFKTPAIILVADHGAWTRYDGEWTSMDVDFEEVKKKVRPIMERSTMRTPGSLIEEKDFALVWHYRNVPHELAYVRGNELRRELRNVVEGMDVKILDGRSVIEVKPSTFHKGDAAAELEALYQPDFILCAGDDYTDEDMFEALPEDSFTIHVGMRDTKARFQLAGVPDMIKLLELLAKQK